MTTWNEIKNVIKMALDNPNIILIKESQKIMHVDIMFPNGRAQGCVIMLREERHIGGMWVEISSAIGDVCNISNNILPTILELAGNSICGEIIKREKFYLFRHIIPIDNLSAERFVNSLLFIPTIADKIEERIAGRDVY